MMHYATVAVYLKKFATAAIAPGFAQYMPLDILTQVHNRRPRDFAALYVLSSSLLDGRDLVDMFGH
jgi:hypothetical protein